jgi:hypothetical protein
MVLSYVYLQEVQRKRQACHRYVRFEGSEAYFGANEIESVSVLKDGASAAIYGAW